MINNPSLQGKGEKKPFGMKQLAARANARHDDDFKVGKTNPKTFITQTNSRFLN